MKGYIKRANDILDGSADHLQVILSMAQNSHKEGVPLTVAECEDITRRIARLGDKYYKMRSLVQSLKNAS